ncbi:MAG: hypothetical protein D6769_02265 [Methanobacteriota archaeon]|nr:MAG: hypothetical protein D6769_02265 [Euryarchaeota archaeon]
MTALTQLALFAAFSAFALFLTVYSTTYMGGQGQQLSLSSLSSERAEVEHVLFDLASCGDGCTETLILTKNITLNITDNTCFLDDGEGNVETCYVPFNGSFYGTGTSFNLTLNGTKLGGVVIG